MHLTISPCWFIYCGHMNNQILAVTCTLSQSLPTRTPCAAGASLLLAPPSSRSPWKRMLCFSLSSVSSRPFSCSCLSNPSRIPVIWGMGGRGVATSTDLPYVADKRESSPTSGCNLTIDTFKIGHRGNGKPPFLPCDHTVWEMGVYLLCVCSQGGEHLLHCPLHQNPTNQAEALPSWLHVLQCLDHQTTWRGDAHHTWCWGSKGSSWHSA